MSATAIEVRPAADRADEERSLAVYNAVFPRESISTVELDSFRKAMLDYGDYVAVVDGETAGSAAVALPPRRPGVGLVFLAVLPDHRARGLGTALYQMVSRWLDARGVRELDAPVHADDAISLGFARRRGFVERERNSYAVLELAGHEPAPLAAPPGIEIVTWAERPELARGIYEVACEAFPDVPGERDTVMEPFEDWLAHEMRGAGDLPEATFLAVAAGEVVGYAKFSFTRARPREASHDITGVKRAWRGRGVAGALKRAQIAWAKDAGYERLVTQNELRNEPIRRLNERLGYRPLAGRVFVRGPIAPA